jgi:hypothetical protein
VNFSRSELLDYYYRDLYPELESLEKERKSLLRQLAFAALIVACAAFLIIQKTSAFGDLTLQISIGALILLGIVATWLTKGYKATFKQRVISRLIAKIAPSLRYDPAGRIPEVLFRMSALFPERFDRYEGSDLIEGEIDGVPIQMSHLRVAKEWTDSRGRRHERTIFSGTFVVTEYHKHFKYTTKVVPDVAEKYFGVLGEWVQSQTSSKLVRMDSPAFEKVFKVFSDDPIEAHYLLTPNIMERLVQMKKRAKAPIFLSFRLRKLYIAIGNGGDRFEPSLFRSLLDFDIFRDYIENLNLILGIVETLNLERKIWSKE